MRAAMLALLLALGACGQQSTTPGATFDGDLPPDQIVTAGFEMRLTNLGVLAALLDSDTAYIYEQARRYEFVGVQASFRDERGSEAGVLTSTTGDYNQGINLFIARGDVVLITQGPNGERRLETDELHYNISEDRIWTERPFTIFEAGRTTTGDAFQTDSNFRTWEVTGVRTQGAPGQGGISF
jgi:LPS export ABC transporter protein LptC